MTISILYTFSAILHFTVKFDVTENLLGFPLVLSHISATFIAGIIIVQTIVREESAINSIFHDSLVQYFRIERPEKSEYILFLAA